MRALAVVVFLFVSSSVLPGAQAQTAPVHKHYEDPPAARQGAQPGGPLAPRLQNLGVHTFKVSTKSARAQLFINQGVNLAYAFNHPEAARSFAEAARLDPRCAMAYWGQALVLGPNINSSMNAEDEPKARALIDKAISLKAHASGRERAYIDALAARYTGKADDRAAADRAYAQAMRKLAEAYPSDLDARTMYAEALMDLRPWNYWTRDGQPYEETVEITRALERVLAANPNHPGALHYWIHLWEPTDTPERAEKEADRLLPLMPGAGHIVHMPAHIYMRVGRHADVVRSNLQAVKADEDYIAQCRAQGIYPLGYYPHNIHFVWMGATASGQRQLALESARKVANAIPAEALGTIPLLQGFVVVPYWAMTRFAQWEDILKDPGPRHETPFTRGAWRYARAMAFTAQHKLEEAERELAELKMLVNDPALDGPTTFSTNSGRAILRVAPEVVAGEIAARRKDCVGAVLLAAGRPDEAEAVYWEDLRNNPGSGWSLFGLAQALDAQGKKEQAARVRKRFDAAWKDADFKLDTKD